MNAGEIECHVVGDIGLYQFFLTGPGNFDVTAVLKIENVAESFLGKDGRANPGIEDEPERQLAIDYDRNNNEVVDNFYGELNTPLPGLEMEPQLGVG